MAIKPPSDLVLDVARAADPLEYRASVEKLRNAQSAVRAVNQQLNVNGFADMAKGSDSLSAQSFSNQPVNQMKMQTKAEGSGNAEAYKKFEAFMLQTFIQNMFTSDTPSVFGKGQAGEFWKSMMAESMAKEMADHGGIGVAKMLENDQRIKQGNAANGDGLEAMQSGLGALAGSGENRQATVDNIMHSKELDLVRKHMSKNT